jgi:hypothetical protein
MNTRMSSGVTQGAAVRHAILAVLCASGLLAGQTHAGRFDGTPEVGTLAYVVTRCSVEADGIRVEQELRVQQGDGEPKTIVRYLLKDLPAGRATPLERVVLGAICQRFGEDGAGDGAALMAPINRVVVSPDGKRVVFHVSDDDLPLNRLEDLSALLDVINIRLPPGTAEGFYVVNTDGTGLRFLGQKVELPAAFIDFRGSFDLTMWRLVNQVNSGSSVDFNPNGRSIAYVDFDREPGSRGDGYLQVMLLDIITGNRSQITDLRAPRCSPLFGYLEVSSPTFLKRHIIQFNRQYPAHPGEECNLATGNYTLKQCRITTRGTGLRCVPLPKVGGKPGGTDPALTIIGGRRSVFSLALVPGEGGRPAVAELFLRRGRQFLQLTNFGVGPGGVSSTRARFIRRGERRVFFTTEADPLGTNPGNRCELFSIGLNGGGLRQITRFNHDPTVSPGLVAPGSGCVYSSKPGCSIGTTVYDPSTDAVVFMSNCDLRGTGAWGEQVFAMWPDGTGVRQLTHTGGCQGLCRLRPGAPDDTSVELPGFLSYAPRHPERR